MAVPTLAVLGVGMVSGVGLTAEESCAAIRCGINNFQETRFIGSNGDWLVGSAVELEEPWRGIAKLAKMAARAISECFAAADGAKPEHIPVLVCVAEPERPGRFEGLPHVLLPDIEQELGFRLHPDSRVIEQGRVGGVVALLQARRMLTEGRHARVIVAGVDTFLTAAGLEAYSRLDRLLNRATSNGFIPGEAASAVLLAHDDGTQPVPLSIRGLGFGIDPAPYGSGRPFRADGLATAIRAALQEASATLKECDHRVTDANGEQFRFKEAALAVTRILRDRKTVFPIWHPADCVGEIGAASLGTFFSVLYWAARKDYLPGPTTLVHLGNDDGKRAGLVVHAPGDHGGEEAPSHDARSVRERGRSVQWA